MISEVEKMKYVRYQCKKCGALYAIKEMVDHCDCDNKPRITALSPCPRCNKTNVSVYFFNVRKWYCPDCNMTFSRSWKKDPLGENGIGKFRD